MSLVRVPIYPTRNLATEIDPGARTINAGTNVSFSVQPDGSITINASGGGTGTVTSVGATGSTGLTVGGSPITTSGTLTFTLSANLQSWSGIAPATKANLASPVFTGDPRAPTPATADNDTSIATTAFVKNQGYATTSSLGSYVLKAGDTMTGALTINSGGLQTRNAGQVKVYDSNNDVPIELGLGYSSVTDRNGYLWNRNNGFLSFGTNNTERVRIQAGGNVVTTGGAFIVQNNDIYTYRTGGTTGVIFLRQDGTRYLFYDGGNYVMPGAPLIINGGGIDAVGTINSSTFAISGVAGTQGFQIMWNTVQSGQGRMEYINNRGGSSGGFTWWDRANTSAGTGTAALYLAPNGDMYPNGFVWPNANASGSKKLSKISVGTAAPSGLIDGELYLRY